MVKNYPCRFRTHTSFNVAVFPEILSRITGDALDDYTDYSVSVFQLIQFCEELAGEANKVEDLTKCVDKLALESTFHFHD